MKKIFLLWLCFFLSGIPSLGKAQSPSDGITCTRPIKKEPVAYSPKSTKWQISSSGVGNIPADGIFPIQLLELEQQSFHDLYFAPIKNKDHYEAMKEGHFDQEGHRRLQLSKIDLTVVMSFDMLIMRLEPGAKLRTPEGTGLGSTLGQLSTAHGSYQMHKGYEDICLVKVPQHPGVVFEYDSCEKACAGEGAYRVVIPGENWHGESQIAPESYQTSTKMKLHLKELRFKHGAALMPKVEKAFSGVAFVKDSTDAKIAEVHYLHGQLHGDLTFFYSNGQKRLLLTYNQGKNQNVFHSWYQNGQTDLRSSITSQQCRALTKFYPNGKKEEEGLACYHQQTYKKWYQNGQQKSEELRTDQGLQRTCWTRKGDFTACTP